MAGRRRAAGRKRTAEPKKPRGGSRDAELGRLRADLAALQKRVALLSAALGLQKSTRPGNRGTLGDLNDAVVKVQDYLLRTSERIDNILGTLKNHRELLLKMNRRVVHQGTRERIRMELDIMMNTLSILAMNGVEVDEKLHAEIEKVRDSTGNEDIDIAALRKAKARLDRRFDGHVRRLDLVAAQKSRDERIPGYR